MSNWKDSMRNQKHSMEVDDVVLTLDQAVKEMRKLGYVRLTERGLWFMWKHGWGPRIERDSEDQPFIFQSEIIAWQENERKLAKKRRKIADEEEELRAKRGRPLWLVIGLDGPDLEDTIDLLKAYACEAAEVPDTKGLPSLLDGTKPDAAFIYLGGWDVQTAINNLEEMLNRDVVCVVMGQPKGGRLPEAVRDKCIVFKGHARGNVRSALLRVPSHLAMRMNLNEGLAYEHAYTLKWRKRIAWGREW